MLANGVERQSPTPPTERLGKDAEREGKQHPRPVHLVQHDMLEFSEIKITVHPIQNARTKQERQAHLERGVECAFYVCMQFHSRFYGLCAAPKPHRVAARRHSGCRCHYFANVQKILERAQTQHLIKLKPPK